MEKLSRELGMVADISLPGFTDNPYAYMSHAAVFVLSSLWEGLPTVFVEAFYVAQDWWQPMPRAILDNGRFGCLTPVQAPAEL